LGTLKVCLSTKAIGKLVKVARINFLTLWNLTISIKKTQGCLVGGREEDSSFGKNFVALIYLALAPTMQQSMTFKTKAFITDIGYQYWRGQYRLYF
jgi:hypothetical protein